MLDSDLVSTEQKIRLLCEELSSNNISPANTITTAHRLVKSSWREKWNWENAAQARETEEEFIRSHEQDVIAVYGEDAWAYKTWQMYAAYIVLLAVSGHEKEYNEQFNSLLAEVTEEITA